MWIAPRGIVYSELECIGKTCMIGRGPMSHTIADSSKFKSDRGELAGTEAVIAKPGFTLSIISSIINGL